MLAPKKVKFRKMMKGRMTGKAYRGGQITLGEFGLKALEPGWVTSRQIEAARIAITRFVKRGGQVWTRIFPDKPITKNISRGVGDEVDLDRGGGRCHGPHRHRRSGRRQRRAVASLRRSTSNWRTPEIGTRTCSSESRSRTVTASSSSDSWSTVIAQGVPISSCRR